MNDLVLLDCTLRDGGYYNSWDFSEEVISKYFKAMNAVNVDVVEVGLRSLQNRGFKGPCAYSSDDFLESLDIPKNLKVGVMVNASELVGDAVLEDVLQRLFPRKALDSPVSLVRIASHAYEFSNVLPAVNWLKNKGYMVGLNLMQIAECKEREVKCLAKEAVDYPLDALYFADSMGSMTPEKVAEVVGWLRSEWVGALGIHTHDNLGLALSNTLKALKEGVTWLDATVTGMGRGPGNALTEELAIEVSEIVGREVNMVPLMSLIQKHFKPMQQQYGWGKNPYYYLAGKYGIHPTYIQQMLSDSRFSEEDVIAVIEYLRIEGGKKFSPDTLDIARHFYRGAPKGEWSPSSLFSGKEILLLGTGPGVELHRKAIESYVLKYKPIVLALNTQSAISAELIDFRIACHPVRLLADCEVHAKLPHPLITPYSMLPANVKSALKGKDLFDFGLNVQADEFQFLQSSCRIPSSLVMAYAFAVSASGNASRILLAGFDGYEGVDPRNKEMNDIVLKYNEASNKVPLIAITPTRYDVDTVSIYGGLK